MEQKTEDTLPLTGNVLVIRNGHAYKRSTEGTQKEMEGTGSFFFSFF